MRFESLDEWLQWQEQLHPRSIDLGLERVASVWSRLGKPGADKIVITVGGTNGKGTTVGLLEKTFLNAGIPVGAFTSPHLVRYNERIRVDAGAVSDHDIVVAFDVIDTARGDTSLTYFEFSTLAALLVFANADVDVMLLEVGLGGRLDAVNILDADVAVIVSLGLDHTSWLGADIESIAREKAGILRDGRPAVYGGTLAVTTVSQCARKIGASLLQYGRDFNVELKSNNWVLTRPEQQPYCLPYPHLKGEVQVRNAACAVLALECVKDRFDIPAAALTQALGEFTVPGRIQILDREPEWILDVAHNVDSARVLADYLSSRPCTGETIAVVGLLADKPVSDILGQLDESVDRWVTVGLPGPRGLDAQELSARLTTSAGGSVAARESVREGLQMAESMARPEDRIVVFGSFQTVGPALEYFGLL